jgi:hypothetical protein
VVDHPDRVCVPVEMEMLPLYRDPSGSQLRASRRMAFGRPAVAD